jgi:diguanylate cyclase (GGDEF)-like protein/PAS domain S-box-containing protein
MRLPMTVAGTLLIVVAEFVLLMAIYHRADPVRHQRGISVALVAGLHSAAGADAAADARNAVGALAKAGVSSHDLLPLRAAATAVATHPQDPAALAQLRTVARELNTDATHRVNTYNLQAEFAYAALLLVASLGWAVWFRKLVKRHRVLQSQVSEQQARTVSEQRLAALVRNSADVVAVLEPDSTITFVTPSTRSVLGMRSELLVGKRYLNLVHPDDTQLLRRLLTVSRPGFDQSAQLRMTHADGRLLYVEGSLTNLTTNPAVNGMVLTIRDVTERVILEEQLTHQALHDPLTGLANRRLFADRLAHALQRRPETTRPLVVLFCDLDDFKNVNDSLGHGTGDLVLAEVAERIRAAVRGGDTAARLGGDEFAILMEDVELTSAQGFAQRLLDAIAEPMSVDGRSLIVHMSIGLAMATPGQITGEDVLRNSDIAMYLAKSQGKASAAVYETRLYEEAVERLQLRTDFERALRDEELLLHYQPTVDLGDESIVGFEALVRWQHPERGLLPPGVFIAMAEESGLVVPLGSWVLRAACHAAARLQSAEHQPKMSVNVAADQLARPEFCDEVVAALADSGLPADRLVLEITEGVVLKDLETVIERLTVLRELGARIAIDDFGTGYSSLAYLRRLPVDILKVDKSFVDRVNMDAQDAALTHAIIAMSRSLRFETVAEGVETRAQARWLTEARCTFGQGYLWSRPVPFAQAQELLHSGLAPQPRAPIQHVVPARAPRNHTTDQQELPAVVTAGS